MMTTEETLEQILATYWPSGEVLVIADYPFPAEGYLVREHRLIAHPDAVPALRSWMCNNPGDTEIDPDCIRPALR